MSSAALTRKATLALIDDAYARLEPLDNITWTPYRKRGYEMALTEERNHRGTPREGFSWKLSMPAAARLFVVKRCAETLLGHRAKLRDLYRLQPSYVHMMSVTLDHLQLVRSAWKGLDIESLAALDYQALV